MRGVSPRNKGRKVKDHASNSTARSSHRGGRPPVVGESLHSHAGNHQVNLERRRGHRRGSVAAECLWTLSFHFPDPRWHVTDQSTEGSTHQPKIDTTQHGRHLPRRYL